MFVIKNRANSQGPIMILEEQVPFCWNRLESENVQCQKDMEPWKRFALNGDEMRPYEISQPNLSYEEEAKRRIWRTAVESNGQTTVLPP